MKWINSLPRATPDHKITVFLVPSVPLVDQQSEHIANNTALRVRGYRGDMRKLSINSCLLIDMTDLPFCVEYRGRLLEER